MKAARSKISSLVEDRKAECNELAAILTQTASLIDGYNEALAPKATETQDALKAYREAVASDYQLNVSKLLSSMGQIAFAPKSPLMYGVQFAEFAYDAVTNITDVQGHEVKRVYVLQQIQNVGANLEALKDGVFVLFVLNLAVRHVFSNFSITRGERQHTAQAERAMRCSRK